MKRTFMGLAILMAAASLDAQQRPAAPAPANDPIRTLVSRLDLEKYKATVKGLTAFGDRRQGTTRNRKAVDWIEAQLKSYGCASVERVTYEYKTNPPRAGGGGGGQGGGQKPPDPIIASGEVREGPGGSRYRGTTRRTGVNTDPLKQPDEKLRALNSEPAVDGERQDVICMKIGSTRPDEMHRRRAHGRPRPAKRQRQRPVPLVMGGARLQLARRRHRPTTLRAGQQKTGLNGARATSNNARSCRAKKIRRIRTLSRAEGSA
jgi:hypothetical protein